MYLGVHCIVMAVKVSSHLGVGSVLYVQNMTLESINDSILCLPNIFYIAPVAFQEINKTIALTCTVCHGIVILVVVWVLDKC